LKVLTLLLKRFSDCPPETQRLRVRAVRRDQLLLLEEHDPQLAAAAWALIEGTLTLKD
jgi:hypothetical protein